MKAAERNLWLLNILAFLFAFRTFEGVWAVYFASVTGSFTLAMSLLAVMHIASSSMEVPTGLLSDYIGRKKTIILFFLFGFLSMLFFYFAETVFLLTAGSIAAGVSMALGSGTLSAFVYENLEVLGKTDLYKKFEGKRRAQSRYSLVIAGVIGTGIIYLYDIQTAILASVLVVFVGLIFSLFLTDLHKFKSGKSNIYRDTVTALRYFKSNASLRDFSFARMFMRGIGNTEYRFRALFLATLMPEWLVNLAGMLNNLISGLVMHANHFFVNKLGIRKSLIHLDIIDKGIVAAFVLMYTATSGILMNIVTSISYGIRDVASEDLLQVRYSKEQRATMGSLVSLGGSIIYIVIAFVSGFIADQIGIFYTMLLFQPFLLISTYFFWRGLKH